MCKIRTRILLSVGLLLCFVAGAAAQSSEQVVFADTDNPGNTGTFVYTNLNPKDNQFISAFGFGVKVTRLIHIKAPAMGQCTSTELP
jgi:hypothetical protein